MGCKTSKIITNEERVHEDVLESAPSVAPQKGPIDDDHESMLSNTISANKPERLYKLLVKAQNSEDAAERNSWLLKVIEHIQQEPASTQYQNPTTKSTPLHMAVRLLDVCTTGTNNPSKDPLFRIVRTLIAAHRESLLYRDSGGNIPLHYAVAPSTHFISTSAHHTTQQLQYDWKARSMIVRHLIDNDFMTAQEYLARNDVQYESGDATGGCSPLYRVLQTLPDDFDASGPTVEYTAVFQHAYSKMVGIGNFSDGDKPLALLYRRFTRQFDISEKFFAGDNSRPEVVSHRNMYKTAAGNTWKIIELLLRPTQQNSTQNQPQAWGIVHRAVQVETPPDLLRYIVETNAQDLTRVDAEGNIPLHHAAKSKPPYVHSSKEKETHKRFPAFYTKYVVDELLYKFPEGASMPDAKGLYPLSLAVQAGKQWIGGGIKSLYDAYPDGLKQIDLHDPDNLSLKRALSMDEQERSPQTDPPVADNGIIKDEQHDAIMLVQQPDVDISEVVTSMWAHEEDAGVQMLGCVAISRKAQDDPKQVLRIALSAIPALVNAMKAHPNEMIVQEKACTALKCLSGADGKREVSMVASGAVAAVVGAMQAHVGDSGVQQEACAAIASIVGQGAGGADRATVVASVSGLTAIVNAIAAHPSSVGVQREGCLALHELTRFNSQANLPEIPKSQTEPLLQAAKAAFPEECGHIAEVILSRMS